MSDIWPIRGVKQEDRQRVKRSAKQNRMRIGEYVIHIYKENKRLKKAIAELEDHTLIERITKDR